MSDQPPTREETTTADANLQAQIQGLVNEVRDVRAAYNILRNTTGELLRIHIQTLPIGAPHYTRLMQLERELAILLPQPVPTLPPGQG